MHGYARVYDASATILLYPQMGDKSGAFASWVFEKSEAHLQVAAINIIDKNQMAEDLLSLIQPKRNFQIASSVSDQDKRSYSDVLV